MYRKHFGLTRHPFGKDLAPEDLVVAWDFTTADDEDVLGDTIAARDAALAELGTDAANVTYEIEKQDGVMWEFKEFMVYVNTLPRGEGLIDTLRKHVVALHGQPNLADDFSMIVVDFVA